MKVKVQVDQSCMTTEQVAMFKRLHRQALAASKEDIFFQAITAKTIHAFKVEKELEAVELGFRIEKKGYVRQVFLDQPSKLIPPATLIPQLVPNCWIKVDGTLDPIITYEFEDKDNYSNFDIEVQFTGTPKCIGEYK